MATQKINTQPAQACSGCRGSGWLVKTQDGVESVVPCPDCRSQARLQQLLKKAAIPPRYFDRGFKEYDLLTRTQERAHMRASKYVEDFPDVPHGLLFAGTCGVGKTHLSVAILKTLIQEKMVAGKFIDEVGFLRRLQYSYSQGSSETEREVMLPLSEIDLLVWDDLGTGRPTEWVKETIRTVINHRYTHKKHTILSTNLLLEPESTKLSQSRTLAKKVPVNLAESIGMPLYSRIMEMCEIVQIDGPDYRTDIDKAGKVFRQKTQEDDSKS